MPKYSIIIPVYKAEKTIKKCVDSILAQQFGDFELILVDDCSPDDSLAICREYQISDGRVTVIHQEPNKGVSAARNAGLDAAAGEYVLFVDSDDFVSDEYLTTVDCFLQDGHLEMLSFGNYNYMVSDSQEPEVSESGMNIDIDSDDSEMWDKLILRSFFASPCNKAYQRSIIEDNHLRFDTNCVCYEDFIFNVEYCSHISSVRSVSKSLYYYRQVIGQNPITKRNWGECFAISRKVAAVTNRFVGSHPQKALEQMRRYTYQAYLVEMRYAYTSNRQDYREIICNMVNEDSFTEAMFSIRPRGKKIAILYFLYKLHMNRAFGYVLGRMI